MVESPSVPFSLCSPPLSDGPEFGILLLWVGCYNQLVINVRFESAVKIRLEELAWLRLDLGTPYCKTEPTTL
ncbi:hypothetical protein BJY04DRAFT_198600 [Aspergillus karnatakaensis]|uniref:uncharacterized protein n=1 Tax=Aspergillus karnatakaensis TaxID=1810916 RepID=UPI003CCDDC62